MKSFLSALLICLLLLTATVPSASAAGAPNSDAQLVSLIGDALISASDRDWARTTSDLSKLKTVWSDAADASPEAQAVTDALAAAERSVAASATNPDAAYQSVSALAKATDRFVTSHEADAGPGQVQETLTALLPHLEKSLAAVQSGNAAQAKQAFESFNSGWKQAEGEVRKANFTAYGKIEAQISSIRIALNTEPIDSKAAADKLQGLTTALRDFAAGKIQPETAPADGTTITDLMALLSDVQADVQQKRAADAAAKMDQFITEWPTVEGEVLTRSQDAYNRIEIQMTKISSLLLSNPPDFEQANTSLLELQAELEPYAEAASYTAWDAGLILFREGLEAILVIAALLAFLNRSGNGDKRKWIWSGAGAGLLASGGLAFLLSALLSRAVAGSSRELIEGYTGLIAVVFMVTVGAWLHKKSNLRAWNQFIEGRINAVIAKGALWSLAVTAFLAVMREGAETIIFYLGMASTIEFSQLALGIGVALLLLALIGFAMLRLSARIPIRPFFLVASFLLYYLAFKFVGVSVHALQISNQLPSHMPGYLLNAPSLGIYPTWETTIPQLFVLAIVAWSVVRTARK